MVHEHKKFDLELSDLRTKLGQMGELVVAQIEGVLACLSEHDVRATRMIIEQDSNVNRMDIDLEEICLQFLALHQPVAGDLRLITATMKITTELERIGDRVVNICEAVHDRDAREPVISHAEVSQMGTLALAMVRDSLMAFARGDGSLARRVFEKDKEFDALYGEAFAKLTAALAKDPERVAHDVRLAFLSRDLNEISEHATNIAEVVMFMIDGKEITHMDMHERRAAR
ncbi:MAG TPA: phosphate signaling complex protein PhoU [Candidatus Binatus sp.]|uniref:phosphate signaling complex protein PhoU n=1 Tax=Candidatus Binatus sp. TaxID=2811406 RepID=UPI002F406485